MNKYGINISLIISVLLIISGCTDSITRNEQNNTSWIFVANEGNMGDSDGSISMINDFGNVLELKNVGDVVQSLEVYGDRLIVLVNGGETSDTTKSMVKIYTITEKELIPEISISTNNSSPREMVIVNDNVYFTNWNTKDIKVLNLVSLTIENFHDFDAIPEDIITDGSSLWISLPMLELYDYNNGTEVHKIDIATKLVTKYNVGRGPEKLTILNSEVYVSRKFFSMDWIAFHGVSIIGNEIIENNYIAGSPCGGSIVSYNETVYRSYGGGIAPLSSNLEINELARIGHYSQDEVYHIEIINNYIWFGITNYLNLNEARVVDSNGNELATYEVGKYPGDFSYWSKK